jgi:hypothetical protein
MQQNSVYAGSMNIGRDLRVLFRAQKLRDFDSLFRIFTYANTKWPQLLQLELNNYHNSFEINRSVNTLKKLKCIFHTNTQYTLYVALMWEPTSINLL